MLVRLRYVGVSGTVRLLWLVIVVHFDGVGFTRVEKIYVMASEVIGPLVIVTYCRKRMPGPISHLRYVFCLSRRQLSALLMEQFTFPLLVVSPEERIS